MFSRRALPLPCPVCARPAQVLNEAQVGDRDFDNVIEDAGKYLFAAAYVAVPPLAAPSAQSLQSQTEVEGLDPSSSG